MKDSKRILGWIPDKPSDKDLLFAVPKIETIPDKFDLRWKGIIPPVRDQKNTGSCTGFGVTAIAWSAMLSDTTFNTPAFHPSELFAYYNGRDDKNNDTGATIREVVDATAKYGVAPLEMWLFDPKRVTEKPPARAYELALKFKTLRRARVPQTEEAMCSVLASGFPIVFGHNCHTSFWNVKSDGIVPMPLGKEEGGHCEYIMAYDKSIRKFSVQNSWSEKRGDRGYEYFNFDHILDPSVCMDFWTIFEISI